MPSPLAPRRTSHRKVQTLPRRLGLATGRPTAPGLDATSVMDRVRQWQAQGGGVITAPEVCEGGSEDEKQPLDGKEAEGSPEPEESIVAPLRPSKRKQHQQEEQDKPSTPRKTTEPVKPRTSDSHRRRSRRDKAEGNPNSARLAAAAAARIHARSVSAPRRRIISDDHWRKGRDSTPRREQSPSGELREPQDEKRPSWTLPDEGIRVRPINESEVDANTFKNDDIAQTFPRRHRRRVDDDGIRVYSTEEQRLKEKDDVDTRVDESVPAPTIMDKLSNKSLNFHSPTPSMRESIGSNEDDLDTFSFEGAEDAAERKPRNNRRELKHPRPPHRERPDPARRTMRDRGRKNSKTGILGHVIGESKKKIFGKTTESAPLAAPQVPSIESWLNGTPDPFVDGELMNAANEAAPPPPEALEDVNNIPPLEDSLFSSSHRLLPQRDAKVARVDSNKIWEALDKNEQKTPQSGTGRHRRHRESVQQASTPVVKEDADEVQRGEKSSDVGTPTNQLEDAGNGSTLRRRGARRKSTAIPAEWRKEDILTRTDSPAGDASTLNSRQSSISAEISEPILPLRPRKEGSNMLSKTSSPHRLSTIPSVDTLSSKATLIQEQVKRKSTPNTSTNDNETQEQASESQDQFDVNGLDRRASKSRVTRHADLISVLSMPRGKNGGSIRSARSVRSVRTKVDIASIPDLMKELQADEEHYLRELRTLVDGVIPVLLTSILSKANSEATICLFSSRRRARDDPLVSQPIYDMGIALERLKRVHKRIPTEHAEAFIIWARGAESVYRDYLKAWRMGFQDVIVNLAPADGGKGPLPGTGSSIDGGLPRDENGDVLGEGGERVDVAFLLKRPLVRLKYLSKTIRSIKQAKHTPEAEAINDKYQALVVEARTRVNEELARLEDEAAADIDPTKARDPCTLAPTEGVVIEESRRVRARDCFNLTLVHSSGQTIDCRIELILRDHHDSKELGGDLLVCEVDGTGRWLLFPPVLTSCVSARNGDKEGEIVVMLRGGSNVADGQHTWHEIMILQSEDQEAGFEWVQMLGLVPVPPQFTRSLSYMERRRSNKAYTLRVPSLRDSSSQLETSKEQLPTPGEIEVPLGEAKRKTKPTNVAPTEPLVPDVPSHLQARLQRRNLHTRTASAQPETIQVFKHDSEQIEEWTRESAHTRRRQRRKTLSGIADQPEPVAAQHLKANTERYSHRRQLSAPPEELFERLKPEEDQLTTPTLRASSEQPFAPESSPRTPKKLIKRRSGIPQEEPPPPPVHRSISPSHSPETIPPLFTPSNASAGKARTTSPLKNQYEPSTASDSDGESDTSSIAQGVSSMSDDETDEEVEFGEDGDVAMPLLPPGALLNKFKKPVPHSAYGGTASRGTATLGPSESASQAPFKHVPPQPGKQLKTIATIYHWSDKGSWDILHPDECSINVTPGLIEAFEMSALHSKSSSNDLGAAGSMKSPSSSRSSSANNNALRPLIGLELTPLVPIRRGTALDISIRSPPTADSTVSASGVLASSSAGNFMFRSRSAEECDALYALINHARCNNPTYIALQHARATSYAKPFGGASFNTAPGSGGTAGPGIAMPGKPGSTSSGGRSSWFGFGQRGGYRATANAATPRATTEPSTTGSVSSMFSAIRRFGMRSSRFSIARSTVTSRQGSRPGGGGSVFSSSDHSSSSGTSTPLPQGSTGAMAPAPAGEAMGLTNAKIRLYVRESASKWRDLGQARMTIMRPGENGGGDATPRPSSSNPSTPPPVPPSVAIHPGVIDGPGVLRPTAADKRIMIVGARKGETLLDATLGESCFERVARTGLAVSVYEGAEDGRIAKEGGVVAGRFRVYMVQMKSEAETAYTFGIVGRMRY